MVFACILLTLAAGCKRSDPSDNTSADSPNGKQAADKQSMPPLTNLARLHWLGKKRISAETNAAGFMQIWNLPPMARLESQTIDKLALALTKRPDAAPITNYNLFITNISSFIKGPSAYLRPLLNDLLQEEFYCEFTFPGNEARQQVLLAIKLDEIRHRLWGSNLVAAAKTWAGTKASQDGNGWQIQVSSAPPMLNLLAEPKSHLLNIEVRRVADWTLVSVGQKDSVLLRDFKSRIERDHAPFVARETNYWFEAENLNLNQLQPLVGLSLPGDLPKLSVTLIGDGENVRTRGKLSFSKPLALELEPWIIPTNLISAPLSSFTAIRGFKPWLESWKAWNTMKLSSAPNQLYIWALQGLPMLTYFAAPHPDASNMVSKITQSILQNGTNFFATNDVVRFERSESSGGLQWKGLPAIDPFLRGVSGKSTSFLLGGLFPIGDTNLPPPAELLKQLTAGATNLVVYDWELTGFRSEQWSNVGDFVRFGMYREQMVTQLARACIDAATPKLGNCGSVITLTEPNVLSFSRRSTVGFTAIELHLLADWLESPNFPSGLHSSIPVPPLVLPPAPVTGNSTNR